MLLISKQARFLESISLFSVSAEWRLGVTKGCHATNEEINSAELLRNDCGPGWTRAIEETHRKFAECWSVQQVIVFFFLRDFWNYVRTSCQRTTLTKLPSQRQTSVTMCPLSGATRGGASIARGLKATCEQYGVWMRTGHFVICGNKTGAQTEVAPLSFFLSLSLFSDASKMSRLFPSRSTFSICCHVLSTHHHPPLPTLLISPTVIFPLP